MKIAITGSIASGKSTCSNILRRMGIPVFDSDNYAKLVYRKKHASYHKIIELLGEEILDENKEIRRDKVAEIIFNDLQLKKALEKIVHPFVLKGIDNMASKSKDIFFAEVPLLYEAGFDKFFDKVILVVCDDETALKRCIEDRGYSQEKAVKILKSQMDKNIKIERADFVLYNNGTIKELNAQLLKVLKQIGGKWN